jgi:hypothetical protein
MPFSFFLFFSGYISGVLFSFFLFPFQFCSLKTLAIFLGCALFIFPKISDFFGRHSAKIVSPRKKEAGLYI